MIGWLFWLELARERRVRREQAWRERELEAQAERQRLRAPEAGLETEEHQPALTSAATFGINDSWLAVGIAILLSPIGYIFGATPYLIVSLIVGAVVIGCALATSHSPRL